MEHKELDESVADSMVLRLFRSKLNNLKALVPYELPCFHDNDVPFYDDGDTTIAIFTQYAATTGTCGSVFFGTVNGFPVAFKALKEENMENSEYIDKLVTEAAFQYLFNAVSLLFDPNIAMAVPAVLGFIRLLEDEMEVIGNTRQDIVFVMQQAPGDTVYDLDGLQRIDTLSFNDRIKLYGKFILLLVAACKFSIAHNDVHERNVMLDVDTGIVSLLDFGYSQNQIVEPRTDMFSYIFGHEKRTKSVNPQYVQLNALQARIQKNANFEPEDDVFDLLGQLCGVIFVRETVFGPNGEERLRLYAKQVQELVVTEEVTSFSPYRGLHVTNDNDMPLQLFS